MNDTAQQLTAEQTAELRRQLRERDMEAVSGSGPGLLPACLACDTPPERIRSQAEDPKFDVDETAIIYRWLPCDHQFRVVVDLDAGPVRPDEEGPDCRHCGKPTGKWWLSDAGADAEHRMLCASYDAADADRALGLPVRPDEEPTT